MTYTEEEARRKWCPFARYASHQDSIGPALIVPEGREPLYEDGRMITAPQKCIASECMAWRKRETDEFITRAEAEFKRTGKRLTSDTGYCGLAGVP
jgi:hypothetical protein